MKNTIKIKGLDTSRVIITFANKDYFQDMLDSISYRYEMDLLVVYKQIIENNSEGLTTRTILKSEIDAAGLTMDDLDRIARKNTSELLPAIITDFAGILIITNTIGISGASAILYSNLVAQLANKFETDVYLIPCSIHEWIALPTKEFSGMDFSQLIQSANRTLLEPKEVLSDHPYIYDRAIGRIRIL